MTDCTLTPIDATAAEA